MRIVGLLLLLVWFVWGCSGIDYYGQAVGGHLDLMNAREPIDEVIADPGSPPELRRRLTDSQAMREFAGAELALPVNDSYRHYVALDRPYVVWNVFATPELSLEPEQWCFLVVGCVAYRGYFAEADARALADELSAQGLDVHVGGAIAYSTLGWFDDPLTSPMLDRGDIALAGLIFHELAHQRLYVKDDSAFNEAYASTVEEMGLRRWLAGQDPARLAEYERRLAIREGFLDLIARTREALAQVYSGSGDEEAKRAAKREVLERMLADYAALRSSWRGYEGYDRWFSGGVNNAKLAAVAIYQELVPDFRRWFGACGQDFGRFHAAMEAFGDLPLERRRETLAGPARCEG
jgi:predicted aminopeptidase